MSTSYAIIAIVAIFMNASIAIADFFRASFVLKNSAEVGVQQHFLPLLGGLKLAGAAGLLLGLLGFELIGRVAAAGLVLFFAGALIVHIRKRVFYNIAFPGAYFAVAILSLVML